MLKPISRHKLSLILITTAISHAPFRIRPFSVIVNFIGRLRTTINYRPLILIMGGTIIEMPLASAQTIGI